MYMKNATINSFREDEESSASWKIFWGDLGRVHWAVALETVDLRSSEIAFFKLQNASFIW